jgi:transcriptional regulator with XRE-family HTH domain
LAEKVSTSTHYIGQIEVKNKFPSPEMLERIAAALEIDSPQLFSMDSYPAETIKQFQEVVLADVEAAVVNAISSRLADIRLSAENNHVLRLNRPAKTGRGKRKT